MLAFFLALSLIPSAFTASTACPNSGEDTTCLDFVHLWQPEVGSAGSWLIKSLDVNSCASGRQLRACSSARVYDAEDILAAVLRSNTFVGDGEIDAAGHEWAENEHGESHEEIWARAWAISGTCMSTIDPACKPEGKTLPRAGEVSTYFALAHQVHQNIDTAAILEEADIVPSETISYSLHDITEAIFKATGYTPLLACDSSGNTAPSLVSITYPLVISGPALSPKFTARSENSLSNRKSTCPAEGIMLHPSHFAQRTPRETKPTHTWDPIYRPSPRPITLTAKSSATSVSYSMDEQPQQPPNPVKTAKGKLGFFKGAAEKRGRGMELVEDEDAEGARGVKAFKRGRDEL